MRHRGRASRRNAPVRRSMSVSRRCRTPAIAIASSDTATCTAVSSLEACSTPALYSASFAPPAYRAGRCRTNLNDCRRSTRTDELALTCTKQLLAKPAATGTTVGDGQHRARPARLTGFESRSLDSKFAKSAQAVIAAIIDAGRTHAARRSRDEWHGPGPPGAPQCGYTLTRQSALADGSSGKPLSPTAGA